MCRGLLVFIFCFTLFQGTAQKRVNPTPEDVALAKKLKLEFEDEDIIILSKEISIRFQKNRKTNLVEVIQDETTQLMGISRSARTQHAVFYDSESEVALFELKDRRGKKVMSRINDEVIKRDDIFHADYRVKYSNVSFPLQGYQYHIKTQKKYNDIKYFTNEYFIDTYRIQKGTITIYIPEWLQIDFIDFNFDGYNIVKEENKTEQGRKITYTLNEIPPQSKEEQTPGPSYMYPHILVQAKSFKNKNEDVTLFNHVSDLYVWYNGLIESVEIDHTAYEGKVAEILEGAISDEEKIKRIYYWVQDNIRYIAFEDGIAGFKPDSPQNVFNKLYGDCKGMANLMTEMLQYCEIDARRTWIGTNSIAYDYSIPSLAVDNHAICTVTLDGKEYYLDATEEYIAVEDYAERIQGRQVLIENGETFEIKEVPSFDYQRNLNVVETSLAINGSMLEGTIDLEYNGESKVRLLRSYHQMYNQYKEEAKKQLVIQDDNNIEVKEVEASDFGDREGPLTLSSSVAIENRVSQFGNEIYLDWDIYKELNEYDIDTSRVLDYHFSRKIYRLNKYTYKTPEGYKLKDFPSNYNLKNEEFEIKVELSQEDGNDQIQIVKSIIIPKAKISVKNIKAWNKAMEELKEQFYEQSIIYEKI